MYVSPLSERIRKRKAFADSELDSNAGLMAMPQSSMPPPSPTLSMNPNAPPFPTHTQPLYAMQTYAQEARYRFHKLNHRSEECDANRFVPRNAHHLPINNSRSSSSITDKTNFFESNSSSPPTSANTFSQIKPKLSFSIESIIGIK